MLSQRAIEKIFHITKLKLLEIAPLVPFLMGRPKEMVCLEVGGNIGLWCEGFMEVFSSQICKYVAYEPMPGNFAKFSERLSQWEQGWPEVEIVNACVGDTPGEVDIHYATEITTLASVVVRKTTVGGRTVVQDKTRRVRQVTLDDEIARLGHNTVDIVKIDVEGYEWNVLQGAMKALTSGSIRNFYFEFGLHQAEIGQDFKQFYKIFKDNGYNIYVQRVGRNYFGLNEVRRYVPVLEEKESMVMVLATRTKPNPEYNGPRVTGRIN